jgi:hypothetical protein
LRYLKTALFLCIFILIFPLYAQDEPQPSPQGEGSPPAGDNGLFFFEELFIFEDAFSFSNFVGEETLPGEEARSDEETLLGAETPPGEETILSEGTPPAEETLLSEDTPPGEGTIIAEEPFIEDDDFFDDDFFFEAPPLVFEVPTFELRAFDTIFPNLSRIQRLLIRSNEVLRHSFMKDESPTLIPASDLEIDLLGSVMKKNPSHLIEALVVVPYGEKEFDLLDIFNALGRIENIKDYPAVVNGNTLYIFTESTRIESARNRKAVPDPLPAVTLPFSQTMYLRLKEISFGNLFIRADISISMYGITYSMTNFTDVRYYLVPIMKAERFVTVIYLEPVKEGILIYSMTGFYLPGFISDKVNLTPNINRRIAIFINWITDGLREQVAN